MFITWVVKFNGLDLFDQTYHKVRAKQVHMKQAGLQKFYTTLKQTNFLFSIETVEDMIKMGVYVNDLNLHDSSRELILAGTQQSAELQLALDQVYTTRPQISQQHTAFPNFC